MPEPAYTIAEQKFDSGRIARRVGVVRLKDVALARSEQILAEAKSQGYDLLALSASEPVDLAGFEPRGVLLHLAGRLGDAVACTNGIELRANTRPLEQGDWPGIEALLPFAAPTRFSRDRALDPARIRRHKLDMLHIYAERDPAHALVALSDNPPGDVVGFQMSYRDDDGIVFYEILVQPQWRAGFAATSLLVSNIRRFAQDCPPDTPLRTRIYEDNAASLKQFERIGFSPTGQRDHHYHAHP